MEKLHKTQNPTIYSVVITHYYILKLIYDFSLGHAKHVANRILPIVTSTVSCSPLSGCYNLK